MTATVEHKRLTDIAAAMDRMGVHDDELWDEQDGFFYDLLCLPGGRAVRLKLRSLVGLLPLCATIIITPEELHQLQHLEERICMVSELPPRTDSQAYQS